MYLTPRANTREVTTSRLELPLELDQFAVVSGLQAQVERLREAQELAERQFDEVSKSLPRTIMALPGHHFFIKFQPGEESVCGTYRNNDETKHYRTGLVDKEKVIVPESGAVFVASYLQYDDFGQLIGVSEDLTQACLVPVTETSDGPRIFGVTMERVD